MRFALRPTLQRHRDPAALGRAGERIAARHLRRNGCRVVARNVTTKIGEIDLVALAPDRRTLILVEVKTRRTDAGAPSAPPPEASVTRRKKQKLLLLAHEFRMRRDWRDRPMRIDVIAIEWPAAGKPTIRHYENAVRA